jgi:hypothetical protein
MIDQRRVLIRLTIDNIGPTHTRGSTTQGRQRGSGGRDGERTTPNPRRSVRSERPRGSGSGFRNASRSTTDRDRILASGKQPSLVVRAIGTPGPELEQTVLARLRTDATDHPENPLVVWREHSAAGFEDHPVDCRHGWGAGQSGGR